MWINATKKPRRSREDCSLSEKVVVTVVNNRTGMSFIDMDCYDHRREIWTRWENPAYFGSFRVTHWMKADLPAEEKEVKKRNPYQWGSTSYLSSFAINETREYTGTYESFRALATLATRMKDTYGVSYEFRKEKNTGKLWVTRKA